MPRFRSRFLVPALALIAFGFLFPALARALPLGDAAPSAAEHHEATPGRLSQLWSLLSALWSETGSILDPDGTPRPSSGSGAEPGAANSGDNGPGLDPDG
jgi:hypothetical protein